MSEPGRVSFVEHKTLWGVYRANCTDDDSVASLIATFRTMFTRPGVLLL